jgi:hypothetical protein
MRVYTHACTHTQVPKKGVKKRRQALKILCVKTVIITGKMTSPFSSLKFQTLFILILVVAHMSFP